MENATGITSLVFILCTVSLGFAAEKVAPVTAVMAIQDAEGMTEADLDTATLKRIEQWIVQRTIERTKQNYVNQGLDPRTFNSKVDVGSALTIVDGKKLAVIRITMANGVRTLVVMGFRRGDFMRVTCIRPSNHDIPMLSGECGQKVTEAFGVSLKAQSAR